MYGVWTVCHSADWVVIARVRAEWYEATGHVESIYITSYM